MTIVPGNSVIREFEYKIAEYCHTNHALAVCNATIGILGVFYSFGLKNSEIITTPLTWHGALSGLMLLNCKLKFCDIEEDTLTLDPEKLEEQINADTRAVFTADFLGYPARLDKIKKICNKHNLILIHDAASSFGSKYKGHFSGHYADVTIFSFGAKKLFTTGQGGCIVTNKSAIHAKLINYLSHPEKQSIELSGNNPFSLNTNINPLAAEYGLTTFERQFENIIQRQEKVSAWLRQSGIKTDNIADQPNFYKILVHSKFKKRIQKYPLTIIHKLPFQKLIYQELAFKKNQSQQNIICPIAEAALKKFLTVEIKY